MCHGVLPPLTAMTNRSRAATAALASFAIIVAALRATASASASISSFITNSPTSPVLYCSILQEGLFGRPRLAPMYLVCIRRSASLLSVQGQQCARLLRRSLHARTAWRLLPSRLRAHVRKHPSHQLSENGAPAFPQAEHSAPHRDSGPSFRSRLLHQG